MLKRVVYEDPIDLETAFQTFPMVLYFFAASTMIHLIMNKVGLLYVEAEILRTGNK